MSRQEAASRQDMVCDRCRDGRLLGEAVHDRDGGWSYYLSCYGCGARTPLGADAHRALMEGPAVEERPAAAAGAATDGRGGARPGPAVAQRAASSFADRKDTCAHPGCTTKVSVYNTSTTCFAHS